VQRPRLVSARDGAAAARLAPGAVGIDADERVQPRVQRGDAVEVGVYEVDRESSPIRMSRAISVAAR
jgi:hypothetical protein